MCVRVALLSVFWINLRLHCSLEMLEIKFQDLPFIQLIVIFFYLIGLFVDDARIVCGKPPCNGRVSVRPSVCPVDR